ncbi:MAG: mannose-1-phosphate guanylyltransferase/mannose-6-phosphate isomerase [Oceanospirillaceae bacterium]|nr:mannose-1-phosphate guanylyltransferase/mannose-6-phosphate isomerase [Oceanospirillaceae bacterium]
MIPVILSGGSGSRLWPLSRKDKPKQFLNLFGDNTLFQDTLIRLDGLEGLQDPIVICNQEHRFMVAEQLQALGVDNADIVLEPFGRNTAPAIAISALQALQSNDDPMLLVLAADHVIKDVRAFHSAVISAREQALKGALVTFGIVPTSPNTGFGYIEASNKGSVSTVNAFVEKPDLLTAQKYLESGSHYWNSGMFLFKATAFLAELEKHSPAMLQACQLAFSSSEKDLDFIRLQESSFKDCPSDSVDYAMMEKTTKAVVVPLDAGWSDVGSWSSLWESTVQDVDGNVLKGDVLIDNVKDSYIHSENRLVSVLGLKDIIVVETADAVMVASKNVAQSVKEVVNLLQKKGRNEAHSHRLCYRPWGHYDCIDAGPRFQVKRITVNVGASLSLQMHHHRAEHWTVVSGTAKITCGDKVMLLSENESTYIPLGTIHRLENPGKVPLEIIEVQSGSYLGEDDIVRLDDDYDR